MQKGEQPMRKAFKYRLYPNQTTRKQLSFVLARCRELYNAALSERKDAYQLHQRTMVQVHPETGTAVAATMAANLRVRKVNYYEQKRDLVEIKQMREEYQQIASHVLQDVLLRLSRAFDAFFRRVTNGETPGFPRFQGRNRYDSFTYPDGAGWKLTVEEQGKKLKGTLYLTHIGESTITLHRPIEGKINTVTIKREVDEWYVIFSCEVAAPEKLPISSEEVGIDLGVTHLATLSNGEMIEHPRYYRKAKKTLEKRQQALSRKKKGSHRRERARQLIGKAHRKIARQRRDFHHKQSRKLVERYQMIVFEDIRMANLTRRPKPKQDETTGQYLPNGAAAKGGLNTSMLDAGWGAFVGMCICKAAWAGRTLVKVNPQFTSQMCSGCGQVRKKDLSERWHSCECGTELDRDVNAAINILARGKQVLARKEPTRATA
jgi:putative transposase